MNPCYDCKMPSDVKCCHTCKKDATTCKVSHQCGKDCPGHEILTNADRIRAMSDDQLAESLHNLYSKIGEGSYDMGKLFCDGKVGCITEDGTIICDEKKEKACVLRWLRQPAEVAGHE